MVKFIKCLLISFLWIAKSSAFEASCQEFPLDDNVLCGKVVEVYRLMNQNWSYPSDNKMVVETVPSWTRLEVHTNQGATSMVCWNFNKEPVFSKALEEIINHPLKMECSNAARIGRLALIHQVIGDEGMLKVAKKHSQELKGFELMQKLSWAFFEKASHDQDNHIYAYPFVNIKEYINYKNGPDSNHNIFKLSNGKYMGFDPEFFHTPKTYEELSHHLWTKMTDKKHVIKEKKKKHIKFTRTLSYEKFEKERQSYQQQIGFYMFNLPKAQEFASQLSQAVFSKEENL